MTERTKKQVVVGLFIALAVGAAVAWAGSDGGDWHDGFPVFATCAALAFAVNWLVFIPSAFAQTEKFYDLTGGVTYLSVIAVGVHISTAPDLRTTLVALMVVIWAVRLSSFLFLRIRKAGNDSRFDEIKVWPLRFFFAWTLQGLWVLITASAALVVITGGTRTPIDAFTVVGAIFWLVGMTIEIVADQQKTAFKANPENSDKFISTGLWAWSRHPNYFGEILLWTGILIIALPVLKGAQWVALISPLFVWFLLTKVSGIPMLQAKSDQRWGGQPDYEAYKEKTPKLIPRPPS